VLLLKEQSETANRRRSFITITKRKWTTGQKPSTKYYTENKKSGVNSGAPEIVPAP
jgi:hypothetical protein